MSRMFFMVFVLLSSLLGDELKDIRAQGTEMLKLVRKQVEKNYFDPQFGGVDMAQVWKQAEQKMAAAQSAGHTFGIIAQALSSLNDSHTFLIPPARVSRATFSWRMAVVGDTCYVMDVRPGGDAEAKGIRPGDRILAIEGFNPARDNLWRMRYMFQTLQPKPALRLAVGSPDGRVREVDVAMDVKTRKKVVDLAGDSGDYDEMIREDQRQDEVDPHRTHSFGKDLLIYHMPDFYVSIDSLRGVMEKAAGHRGLIIDLRGNGGGSVEVLEYAAGYLLGKDVVVASRNGRKEEKPVRTRGPGDALFKGQLLVLVDSESGSAAELLARTIQLEGRGKVMGDRTSGSVRQSRHYSEKLGIDRVVPFGVSVTNADLLMKDGKSLEHVGVQPDEVALPTAGDLAAGRDPILSRAAAAFGVALPPEQAAQLFPRKWLAN